MIVNAKIAKDAQDKLNDEFQGNAQVRDIKLQSLRADFENLTMSNEENINQFFSRVIDIINQMRIYGEDIKEVRIVIKMLNTVAKNYDTPVSVIQSTNDLSTWSILKMINLFKAQEQRDKNRTDQSSSEKSFQASQNGKLKKYETKNNYKHSSSKDREKCSNNCGENKGRYPSCRICKKTNHLEKDCRWRGKLQCNHCNMFGHIDKDCRKKSKQA